MSVLLEKCTSCDRHVRQDEVSCPFCGVVLPATFRLRRERPRPAGRLSRAALWALGASSVSVGAIPLAACGGDDAFVVGEHDALVDASYGAAPPDEFPPGSFDAAYGGSPAHVDAGDDDDDAPPTIGADAGYGGPPPHDAGPGASDAGDADTD